jgi:hypothetical protein
MAPFSSHWPVPVVVAIEIPSPIADRVGLGKFDLATNEQYSSNGKATMEYYRIPELLWGQNEYLVFSLASVWSESPLRTTKTLSTYIKTTIQPPMICISFDQESSSQQVLWSSGMILA